MKIREAAQEDWLAIKGLIENSPELMSTHLTSWRSFFVAEHDEKIVGCCALAINIQEDLNEEEAGQSPKTAEIRSLVVEPEFRKQGIGSMLIERCIARTHERKIYEVCAYTNALELFERFGLKTCDGWKHAVFKVLGNGNSGNKSASE